MKVEVRTNSLFNLGAEVPVVRRENELIVWCNHAVTHEDEKDFGYADARQCDWVDDWKTVEICDKCKAWRLPFDCEWNEEQENE